MDLVADMGLTYVCDLFHDDQPGQRMGHFALAMQDRIGPGDNRAPVMRDDHDLIDRAFCRRCGSGLWYRLTGGSSGSLTDGDAQVTGMVSGRSAGDLSESYAALASGMSLETMELLTTRPGAAFAALRQTRPAFGARLIRV